MANFFKYDGISFNQDYIASLKEKEFLDEAAVNKHWFPGDHNRTAKLKEVYAMAIGKKQIPVEDSGTGGQAGPDEVK